MTIFNGAQRGAPSISSATEIDALAYIAFVAEAQRLSQEARMLFEIPALTKPNSLALRQTLVAMKGLEIIGSVRLSPRQKPELSHKAFISGLYVRLGYRRCGVARALLNEAISRAGRDIEELILVVRSDNAPAFALYKNCGFEEYGIERRSIKLGDVFYDERLMRLALKLRENSDHRD